MFRREGMSTERESDSFAAPPVGPVAVADRGRDEADVNADDRGRRFTGLPLVWRERACRLPPREAVSFDW